jgi:dimethylhistidine N-methyltransferase
LQPRRYVPIDISTEHLEAAAEQLGQEHPGLLVLPLAADYTAGVRLPPPLAGAPRIGFFPGSTIGNFAPAEALQFLRNAARLLRGGGLLLGADLVKDPAVLHAAYNDAQGVTADFNLNLLARANRELGTGFDLGKFWHSAFYNAAQQRIEMHLVSRERQRVELAGELFTIEEGQALHTENSHKFSIEGLRRLARQAGFEPGPAWTDEQGLFSVHWLAAPAD